MKKKILIIDDDQEMCEEIAEILKDEGYLVSMAFDGLRGKNLIEKYDYDLLILDVKMPGLSGLDILESIKERNMKLEVLVLTGKPLSRNLPEKIRRKDKEEYILELADGIISKPFDIKILLSKIKQLLDKDDA